MVFWIVISIYLILENVFIAAHDAQQRCKDLDTVEQVCYGIGSFFVSLIVWPLGIVGMIRDNKTEKKTKMKNKKNEEKETIGFKTKAEIMAMEARKDGA